MPKQIRYTIKQKIQSAVNETIKAGNAIIYLQELYASDGHEDIAETLAPYLNILQVTTAFLEAFSKEV